MREETIRPTLENIEKHSLPINIRGVKVVVECAICGHSWSVYTADETAYLNFLPSFWWKCSECRKSVSNHG